MDNKKTLALFDFDGTITSKDTFIELLKYHKGIAFFILAVVLFSPILILYKLKLVSNTKAKQLLFSFYFKNMPLAEFESLCCAFTNDVVNFIIKPKALTKIQEHQQKGDHVIVVSAGIYQTIFHWTKTQSIELIATEPEIVNGLLTGFFSTPNCYGKEKVNRIEKKIDLKRYREIVAYGDSAGDKEMLGIATHSFYKPF